jgi:hypothetical protein
MAAPRTLANFWAHPATLARGTRNYPSQEDAYDLDLSLDAIYYVAEVVYSVDDLAFVVCVHYSLPARCRTAPYCRALSTWPFVRRRT